MESQFSMSVWMETSVMLELVEGFIAEEEGEITVQKGEIVQQLEEEQDGWIFVQNTAGEAGLIPAGFTVPVVYEEDVHVEPEPESTNVGAPEYPEEVPIAEEKPNPIPRQIITPTPTPTPAPTEKTQPKITPTPSPPKSAETAQNSVDSPLTSPRQNQPTLVQLNPQIIRIYTNEDIHKEIEEKELGNPKICKTFKSIRATIRSHVRQIIDDVAKKLLLPDTRQYHLFIIDRKALTMKLLREDERPVEIQNNSTEDVTFALIFAPKVKVKVGQETRWQTDPGDLTHRQLINDQPFLKFADFVINIGSAEVATFKAIAEVRFPNLLDIDPMFIKKKKVKNMAHGVGEHVKLNEGVLTLTLLQNLLDYMYTGRLENVRLNLETTIQLFKAGKQLRYDSLCTYCRAQIEKSIGLHNIFLLLKFTVEPELVELKEFAHNFCLNNWQTISASKEGLAIIGLALFQEITVIKANMQGTPPLQEPTPFPENTIVQDFQKIRALMHFADAVSQFGNTIMPFHRCILAAASPKFQTLFAKEASASSKKLPQFTFDVSAGAFKGFIDLVYSGTTNMTALEACEILEHIAIPYELHSVREDCEALLCQMSKIDITNVLKVLRITYLKASEGRTHVTVNARVNCLSFLCANFRDIDMEELKSFSQDTHWEVLQMLNVRCKKNNIVGLA